MFCCTNPGRPVSPINPPKPLRAPLDPYFTIAALPRDHPHALQIRRPPSLNRSLIRSPSIVSKLKGQLKRKSTLKSLQSHIFDVDPSTLTSTDVLDKLDDTEEQARSSFGTKTRGLFRTNTAPDLGRYNSSKGLSIRRTRAQHARSPSSRYSDDECIGVSTALDGHADELNPYVLEDSGSRLSVTRLSIARSTQGSTRESASTPTIAIEAPFASEPSLSPLDVGNPVNKSPANIRLSVQQPSLALYEHRLSVCGDDRRRPSSLSLTQPTSAQGEAPRDEVALERRPSSKRTSLSDRLMEAALERQLQEKASFRSPSKANVGDTQPLPAFVTMTWTESGQHEDDDNLALDPLNETQVSNRDAGIAMPDTSPGRPPPNSWCRWSSQSRGERSGSASLTDDVITRDFALEKVADKGVDHGYRHVHRPKLQSSKSRTLVDLKTAKRYYTDIFTTVGFRGKGRRTSVWETSGKLKDPDLEMLPPALPDEITSPSLFEQPHFERKSVPLLQLPNPEAERDQPTCRETTPEQSDADDSSKIDDSECPPKHHEFIRTASPVSKNHELLPTDGASDLIGRIEVPQPQEEMSSSKADDTAAKQCFESHQDEHSSVSNKAEDWSALYSECVARPFSPTKSSASISHVDHVDRQSDESEKVKLMSCERAQRALTPDSGLALGTEAKVRKFPSVTVVDHGKGHWRSVSLISVRSDGSFIRDSSNDLLKLVEQHERDEREKLLTGIASE